jgi:hypothetical protein
MPSLRSALRTRRLAALGFALAAVAAVATQAAVPSAGASAPPSTTLTPGDLLVATSVYQNDPSIVAGSTQLPPGCGGSSYDPCGTAVANGDYPYVFNNDSVDGSFGVTSPITLDELTTSGTQVVSLQVPNSSEPGVSSGDDQMVTSFSSKSELALNLSTDGQYVTFMGYNAPVDAADVSNDNTPGDVDPTSADPGANYREVAQLGQNGNFSFTETNAYSGDNGRAAILNDEGNSPLVYMAGNAGNGANPEPAAVVTGAGAQLLQPSNLPTAQQNPGQPTPVGSFNVTQLGYAADKSGKDDNFRGIGVYNNVLYYTKGSGSNGVDTVYFVDTSGSACPHGTGLPQPGASLPTTSSFTYTTSDPALGLTAKNPGLTPENMCILNGFPAASAKTATDTSDYPFGLWFANPYTLYVADEGAGDSTYNPSTSTYGNAAASTTAGLQKWVFDPSEGQWNLAYTLQAGLNLGQPYTVPGYPTGDNTGPGGTGLPWAPATDGLRDLTGQVNANGTVTIWATTSTVSGSGDQGADPNQLVSITDNLAATTAPAGESFQTVMPATNATVYRGVSFTPGTSAPAGNVTCAGNTYSNTTISGNVTVPPGSTCTLTDVTVDGNVQVQQGGSLVDTASAIQGNLQASHAASVVVQGGTIGGNLQVQQTTGMPDIGDASTANDLCGATVTGNVQVGNNGAGAPFDIGAAPDCASPLTVGGNLQVNNNAGAVAIGPAGNGAGNTVQNNIQVNNNTGGGTLTDNSADGNCQLGNDTPGIVGSGNTAAGHNTCNATA